MDHYGVEWRVGYFERFLALDFEDDALDAGAESYSRGGVAAEDSDEGVVAASAEEGSLGAFGCGFELEDGAVVVVESAYQCVVDAVVEVGVGGFEAVE